MDNQQRKKPAQREIRYCRLRGVVVAASLKAIASAAVLAFLAGSTAAQDQDEKPPGPAERLEARGLVRAGLVWITPVEAELRQLLIDIRKQHAEYRGVTRKFDQALKDNNQQLALVKQARAEANELDRRIDAGMASGALNVRQINQLTAEHNKRVDFVNSVGPGLYDPESKVNSLPLARLQEERIELRNAVILKLLKVDRIVGDVEASYVEFTDDEAIAADVAEAGRNNRLGPTKVYTSDVRRLARARNDVLNEDNPVNREDEEFRMWAILNDEQSVQVTFDPESELRLLSAADADNLGIEIPDDVAEEMLQVSDDKQVAGRPVTFASLRLGNQILVDVTFHVLGDKDADLGSILGGKTLAPAQFQFQPELLMLKVSGAEPADVNN